MRTHEAIQTAVNGKTIDHAKALGLSVSMISKWQEPSLDFSDSGAYNPLDRIETIIKTSLNLGNESERAMSPLYYLAGKFNQIIFPAPPPNKSLSELHQELSRLTKEFGDLLSVLGTKLADGDVSCKDVQAIKKEAAELQRAIASLIAIIEMLSKNRLTHAS